METKTTPALPTGTESLVASGDLVSASCDRHLPRPAERRQRNGSPRPQRTSPNVAARLRKRGPDAPSRSTRLSRFRFAQTWPVLGGVTPRPVPALADRNLASPLSNRTLELTPAVGRHASRPPSGGRSSTPVRWPDETSAHLWHLSRERLILRPPPQCCLSPNFAVSGFTTLSLARALRSCSSGSFWGAFGLAKRWASRSGSDPLTTFRISDACLSISLSSQRTARKLSSADSVYLSSAE